MSRLVALSTLRTRSQQRANLEGASLFIPSSEWNDMINESIADYYDLVRQAFGMNYFRKELQFTSQSGVSDYNSTNGFPTDFLSLISCDVTLGPNIFLRVKPFMEDERNVYKFFPTGWFYGQPIYYQLQEGPRGASGGTSGVFAQGQIRFIPTPQAEYTIQLNYVPTAPILMVDGDQIDGISGWDEYVTLDAAIKALTKDGDDEGIGRLAPMLARVKARIEALAPQRDYQGERVVDVTSISGQDWY